MGRGGLRTERGKRKKKEREREKQKQKTRNENRRENLQMKIVNQLPNQTQVWLLLLHPPGGGGGGGVAQQIRAWGSGSCRVGSSSVLSISGWVV